MEYKKTRFYKGRVRLKLTSLHYIVYKITFYKYVETNIEEKCNKIKKIMSNLGTVTTERNPI